MSGNNLISIGFWAASYLDSKLFGKLPWPGNHVDNSWDEQEKEDVALYLDHCENINCYFGWSTCRLCGYQPNGYTDKSNGVYVWPEGYSHYIRAHNVRPPQEFIEFALSNQQLILKLREDFRIKKEIQSALMQKDNEENVLPSWVKINAICKVVKNNAQIPIGELCVVDYIGEKDVLLRVRNFNIHVPNSEFINESIIKA